MRTRVRIWRSSTDSAARSARDSSNSPIALRARCDRRGVRLLPLLRPARPADAPLGGRVEHLRGERGQRRVQVVPQRHPGQRLPAVLAAAAGRSSTAGVDPEPVGQHEVDAGHSRRPGRWRWAVSTTSSRPKPYMSRVTCVGQLGRQRRGPIRSRDVGARAPTARGRRTARPGARQQGVRRRARSRAISPVTSIGERRLVTSQRTARSSSRRELQVDGGLRLGRHLVVERLDRAHRSPQAEDVAHHHVRPDHVGRAGAGLLHAPGTRTRCRRG